MENLPINILDIGVMVFLILSAIIGLIFGFINGGLFIISWLGAAFTTIIAFPYIKPFAREYIENKFFADVAGGIAIFIITIILLFLVSSIIGGWVRNSRLNVLDRSLGMVAAITISSFLLLGAYVIVENIWPVKKQPVWITKSKIFPILRIGAHTMNNVLPEDLKIKTMEIIENKTDKTLEMIEKETYERFVRPKTKDPSFQNRNGYSSKERRGIENFIERIE
jgi:membrane protein required for colicin V production